jgi:flagellin
LEEEPIGIHIQNSSNVGDYIIVSKMAMNTVVLGMFGANTKTYADSQKTIAACDNALSVLNKRRARFGSEQNRLEHTYRNSQNAEENQQSAESRIRDTDMAEEMVNNSKHDILQQAGQAMLAQANQNNQGILSLLQ